MPATCKPPLVSITIIKYPKQYIFFALLAMAIHRLPLLVNRGIYFWKLLGCGKGGGFSRQPDWRQWAVLTSGDQIDFSKISHEQLLKKLYGNFIAGWYRFFRCGVSTILLEPVSGHGCWDGKQPFGSLAPGAVPVAPVAVLTRATIRAGKIKRFWEHMDEVSHQLHRVPGLISSLSIGEIPFLKQATFSIWNSSEDMHAFAYGTVRHINVVQKTREEKWYTEELFVRFKVLVEYRSVL
ncbi:MAG: DUF3291 domain-containing protein [Sphingobacteriales bacterium]|nr:DUF3291 domain-containing protein [Sphingobacteriales bacterium]OJY81868.1 MAG: hypothetical protein BGP14_03665 [Sphingobacteriales bacterium 44-15]